MIYLKPRNLDEIGNYLRDIIDADGWFILPENVSLRGEDFKSVVVKINGIVFKSDSAEFQKAYSKFKTWKILQNVS